MQHIIHLYRETTGKTEIDMHEVVNWAVDKLAFPLPVPPKPKDILAKEFAKAAREEERPDAKTGRPYRVNHAIAPGTKEQHTLWIDIDEAPRKLMLKSLIQRREQMVGDGLHLSLDTDHWNSINPGQEPIVIQLDFTEDIEWRKNAPDENHRAS